MEQQKRNEDSEDRKCKLIFRIMASTKIRTNYYYCTTIDSIFVYIPFSFFSRSLFLSYAELPSMSTVCIF